MITNYLDISENSSTGQKTVTIPSNLNVDANGCAKILTYGKNWESIPGYLKTHQELEHILTQLVRVDDHIGSRNRSDAGKALEKIREASKLVGEAMDALEEEFTVDAEQDLENKVYCSE